MELTKAAQAVKKELEMELSKQGSSLIAFEKILNNINNGEGVYKFAAEAEKLTGGADKAMGNAGGTLGGALGATLGFGMGGPLGGILGGTLGGTAGAGIGHAIGAVPSAMELGLKGSVLGGALGGLTLDEMDKSVDSLNKALEREREKITLVKRITQNLKKEHGLV
jgi:hypothetical protein